MGGWGGGGQIYFILFYFIFEVCFLYITPLFFLYMVCHFDTLSSLLDLTAGPVRDFQSLSSVSKDGCYA